MNMRVFLKSIQWLSIQKVIFTLVLGELHRRGLWNTTCSMFCLMKYSYKWNIHYDNDISAHSVYLQTVFYGLCLIIKYILLSQTLADLLGVTTLDDFRFSIHQREWISQSHPHSASQNCSLFIKENQPHLSTRRCSDFDIDCLGLYFLLKCVLLLC